MDKKYDVIAIGMGPSSVFMAYELVQLKKEIEKESRFSKESL